MAECFLLGSGLCCGPCRHVLLHLKEVSLSHDILCMDISMDPILNVRKISHKLRFFHNLFTQTIYEHEYRVDFTLIADVDHLISISWSTILKYKSWTQVAVLQNKAIKIDWLSMRIKVFYEFTMKVFYELIIELCYEFI